MKKFLSIVLIASAGMLIKGQDSTSVQYQINELKSRVDSLEALLKNSNLDSLKTSKVNQQLSNKDTSETDDLLSEITAFFSFTEQDRSSKRKRIDQLLSALRSQPGQITFKGDATSILQWKTGNNHFAQGSGSFDLFAFVGFGNNTNLFIDIEAIGGNGPNQIINSFSTLNGDAGSLQDNDGRDLLHVLEAWSEFRFFGDLFKVTMGKIDLTNYFDINEGANDETMQFISGPFINSAAFPVPSNSPGMRSLVGIEDLITFQFGLVSQDNSGSDIFNQLFKIIGTELNANFAEGYYGKIHFFAYADGIIKDASGYGISFSGTVANKFKLFGRWNKNNPNYAKGFSIKDFWSIGTEFNSNLFNKNIVVGASLGEIDPYQLSLNNELVSEAYLRFQFNDWVYMSPHIQFIHNTGGGSSEYLLVSLRTQINF